MAECVLIPSPEEVEAPRTPKGAWTKRQLAAWGVPWPPPRGWKADLEKRWRMRSTLGILGYHPARPDGWLRPILPEGSYCRFCNAYEPGPKVCRVCGRKLVAEDPKQAHGSRNV
jgi:hypothetical protein